MSTNSYISICLVLKLVICRDIPQDNFGKGNKQAQSYYYIWDMPPVQDNASVPLNQGNEDLQTWYSLYYNAMNGLQQPAAIIATKPTTPKSLTTLATATTSSVNSLGNCGSPKAKPLAPNCSINSQAIVGGVKSAIQAWPWQVAFTVYDQPICGGTIISPNHVVTAAHCTSKYTAADMGIVTGNNDLNAGNLVRRKVSKLIQHSAYDPSTVANDISILVLEKALTFTDDTLPACLPSTTDTVVAGEGCYVTGWGNTQDPSIPSFQQLREVCLNVVDHKQCVGILGVSDKVFCAGEMKGGKDSCQGDSGGPLVCKRGSTWKLMGIVSWGVGCAKPNYPGVYTEVAKYRDWIKTQIGI